MKNWQLILTSLISGLIGWGILCGPLPYILPFAGPENELGCAVISLTMCVLSIWAVDYKKLWTGLK
jgi:hypothetical protein